MSSASVVEPRMSAKSMVNSISAPPWCVVTNVKHELHIVGFASDCRLPISRIAGAATPANGAAHIRQRGSCGRCWKNRLTRCSAASPRVRKSRQNASSSSGGLVEVTPPRCSWLRIAQDILHTQRKTPGPPQRTGGRLRRPSVDGREVVLVDPLGGLLADPGAVHVGRPEVEAIEDPAVDRLID